jgi:hypothetical protein
MFGNAMEEADRARLVENLGDLRAELRACRERLTEVLAELRSLEQSLSDGNEAQAGEPPPIRLHSVR